MNIIICVDKSNGMMFNNRRQSQDREVIKKIMDFSSGSGLFMSEYSAELFSEYTDKTVSDTFLSQAKSGDFCFIEDAEFSDESIENIYIFNWNRDYPADKYFTFDLKANGFKKVKKEDFSGYSHKKITLEIYRRQQI